MATWALCLLALYGLLAIGLRVTIHHRRTGSWGVSGISGSAGSIEWLGGVLFTAAIVLAVAAPVLAANDRLEAIDAIDGRLGHVIGFALFALGAAGTVGAQAAMGRSWRIGVDEQARTELVTGGPFTLVRNPIYSAMIPAAAGIALLVPSVVAIAAVVLLVVALELQVRAVEEPYLLRVHGDAYRSYASRVGRFVPRLGRLGE
jgi:protein-S-isoprenylcysteine O-methyltransferase Ste14